MLAGHSDNLLREALTMPCSTAIAASFLTALLWITVYNVTYDLTHRASSPDYDNHMDIAFGIYLFGWLTALQNHSHRLFITPFTALAWTKLACNRL